MTRRKKQLVAVGAGLAALLGYVYFSDIVIPASKVKFGPGIGMPDRAVIAHRGASYLAPEETEPAYLLARDMGVDYLEMDLQRTKDHALIVLHDDTLERTTNVKEVFPGREKDTIDKFTLAEIKQLDAGSWFNRANPDRARAKYAGVKILTLEEVIAIAESGAKKPAIYIETKSASRYPGYEKELVELLSRKGWLGKSRETELPRVIFQSFYESSLQQLKALAPEIPRVFLFGRDTVGKEGWGAFSKKVAEYASGIGPVAYLAWPWNLSKAHQAGLAVHPYTINNRWGFGLLAFFGANGFFTDRCDVLMRFYGRNLAAEPESILARHGY